MTMAARYTPLSHEDSDDETSPQDVLLAPSINSEHEDGPKTYSGTFNPALVLHLASLVGTIIAFIVLIINGGEDMIAADIFLVFILIIDVTSIFHSTVSNVFKITVELRNGARGAWKSDYNGEGKTNWGPYVDFITTFCLFICLSVGTGIRANSWHRGWEAGSVFGYLVIAAHLLLAIPAIHKSYLTLTLTAKVTPTRGKTAARSESAVEPSGRTADSDSGSARRRTADDEQPRQPVEDLV